MIAEFGQMDDNMTEWMARMTLHFSDLLDVVHKVEELEHAATEPQQKKKLGQFLRKKKSGGGTSSKPSSAGSDRSSPILVQDQDSDQQLSMTTMSTLSTMSSLSGSNPSLSGFCPRLGETGQTRPVSLPADGRYKHLGTTEGSSTRQCF